MRRSGSPLDAGCDPSAHKLAPDAKHYLVIDTNVALHQVRGSSSSSTAAALMVRLYHQCHQPAPLGPAVVGK
jgi:hypothetical protein